MKFTDYLSIKHKFFFLSILVLFWLNIFSIKIVNAQKGNIGIGAVISEVPALSCKIWLENERVNIKRNTAFDFALGFSNEYVYFHTTYLIKHNYNLIKKVELTGELPFYYGPGIKFKSNSAGIRFPFGIEYIFEEMPLDIFAEIVPSLLLFGKKTTFELSAGIGVRYFWSSQR